MSNRYSKTGFTKREEDKLEQIRSQLAQIYDKRLGKQDSEQALLRLLRAREAISQSIFLSDKHKNA